MRPTDSHTYARTLARAVDIAGGVDHLAEKLEAPKGVLLAWLAGYERVPLRIFLKAVDLLVDQETISARTDPRAARAR